MKAGEAKDRLNERMAPILTTHRFLLRKKEGHFSRNIAEGSQVIGCNLFNYSPRFDLSVSVCLRFEEVEAIYEQFSGGDPKSARRNFTIASDLTHFAPELPRRFQLLSLQDVDSAVEALRPVITERVIPFLDGTQSISDLAKALQSRVIMDLTIQPYRSMHAVIVGFLNRGSDLDTLVSLHRPQLKSLPPDFQQKFEELVKHLLTIGQSRNL